MTCYNNIDSTCISTEFETSHVRPLKRVTKSTVNPRLELSQFCEPEKERPREIKEEDDASSRYLTTKEHFGNDGNDCRKEKCYLRIERCECI